MKIIIWILKFGVMYSCTMLGIYCHTHYHGWDIRKLGFALTLVPAFMGYESLIKMLAIKIIKSIK